KAGTLQGPVTEDIDEKSAPDRPISLPEDAFAPTTPYTAPFAPASDVKTGPALPSDVMAATSSDLGLSRAFAAMGCEDERGTQMSNDPRPKSLSVNLDIGKLEPAFPDHSGPFQMGRSGGSLNQPLGHDFAGDDDEGETIAGDGPPTSRFD